jgi:proteasome accessory factor C
LIKKLIQSEAGDNPLRNLLLKKLALNSEIDSMPRLFVKARLGKFVEVLAESIKEKKQVVLKNYHSANSNEIRDRIVEPIHFGDNYQSIVALDVNDKASKQFKLDRIGEIVETSKKFQFESQHQKNQSDIFGFNGDANTWITMSLGMRAYLLLREEYPLSVPFLEKREKEYYFHAPVAGFEGAGRFVLGLMDDLKVIGPDSFKDYLQKVIAGFSKSL